MNKNLTELVFILDRSGSMSGLEADTIGGFNSLVNKQRKEEGEAVISTVLFDDVSELVYDRVDVKDIKDMTDKEYYVRGCTALLDAVGSTINHISSVHKELKEEEIPGKTLFVITTDGCENASKEYDAKKVKKLIKKKQEKNGWEFLFLGANIDAVKTAGDFGINKHHAVNYKCDSKGTANNFKVLSKTISKLRTQDEGYDSDMLFAECCMEIDEDYRTRK